jgi:hypothetical protein
MGTREKQRLFAKTKQRFRLQYVPNRGIVPELKRGNPDQPPKGNRRWTLSGKIVEGASWKRARQLSHDRGRQ